MQKEIVQCIIKFANGEMKQANCLLLLLFTVTINFTSYFTQNPGKILHAISLEVSQMCFFVS